MARSLPTRSRKVVDLGSKKLSVSQPSNAPISLHVETLKNVFNDKVLLDMKPLTDLAKAMGLLVRNRVRFKGKSGKGGKFSKYPGPKERKSKAPGNRKGSDRNEYERMEPYWVPAHYPQGGEQFQITHKTRSGDLKPLRSNRKKGARAYKSRRHYQQAISGNVRKRFTIMGDFWRGLKVRPVKAGYVRVAFFKSSWSNSLKKRRVANRTKARQMNKFETVSILQPNKKEMKWANEYCRLYITSSFLNTQGAQELRIKALRAEARIEKRIKAWAKRFGGS
tara:strand:- start:8291 stop:9127 length:837 start_codon:yes stop_codon:yes gene_type:complete